MTAYTQPEQINYGEEHRKVLQVLRPTTIWNRMSESQIYLALKHEFSPSLVIDELRDSGDIYGSVNFQISHKGIGTLRALGQHEKNGHSKENRYKDQQESR